MRLSGYRTATDRRGDGHMRVLMVGLGEPLKANDLRLIASTLAGLHWGRPAMILFHDWVGTIWTLAFTLIGDGLRDRLDGRVPRPAGRRWRRPGRATRSC